MQTFICRILQSSKSTDEVVQDIAYFMALCFCIYFEFKLNFEFKYDKIMKEGKNESFMATATVVNTVLKLHVLMSQLRAHALTKLQYRLLLQLRCCVCLP